VGDATRAPVLAAVGLFTAFAVARAANPHTFPDFFIFRLGSELTARGENPYDLAKVRAAVAAQFPDPDPKPTSFVNNCGYFLPPAATVLFLPFAALPWREAKVAWALLQGLAAVAIATLPQRLRRPGDPAPAGLLPMLVPLVLLLNWLPLDVVTVGQFAVVFVGCVAGGLWCFERGGRWVWVGVLLWAAAFVKPHVALPLVPLAWYLGGWRRAAALVAAVAALNLLGATLAGGSPLFLRDYFAYLGTGFGAVVYNRAELNYEMTSWNRLLFVTTGVLVEQTAATAVAAYLAWFGLVALRCRAAGVRPSAAWALAAAAAGAAWCPQVLGYEAFVLVLAVPWVRDLFAAGRRGWAAAAVLLLALQAVRFGTLHAVGFEAHRPVGVALFALVVLAGPPRPGRAGA
jgi:hypothetical protein